MAGVAGAGAIRPFPNIVSGRVPVIGQGVEVLHFDAFLNKRIPDRRNQAQRRQRFFVPWITPQNHFRAGFGAFTRMALLTVAILRSGMAAVAGHLALMRLVRHLRRGGLLAIRLVAIAAGRTVFYMIFGCISLAVAVKFLLLVAVHAKHPLLIMDIRGTAVFARIFRINPSTMAGRTGFTFIFFDKLMFGQQSGADAADRRGLDVTITAGCMATSA